VLRSPVQQDEKTLLLTKSRVAGGHRLETTTPIDGPICGGRARVAPMKNAE